MRLLQLFLGFVTMLMGLSILTDFMVALGIVITLLGAITIILSIAIIAFDITTKKEKP